MDHMQEEKREALQALEEYLQKLVLGMATLCGELKGSRQPDTDVFQNQCMDGLNWAVEVYNRVSDVLDLERIHISKQEMNGQLCALGAAIRDQEDRTIAEILENTIMPFLKELGAAARQAAASSSGE